jgi:hypothetical protein
MSPDDPLLSEAEDMGHTLKTAQQEQRPRKKAYQTEVREGRMQEFQGMNLHGGERGDSISQVDALTTRPASKANLRHRPVTQEGPIERHNDRLMKRISQENIDNAAFIESIKGSKNNDMASSLRDSPDVTKQASPLRNESTRSIKRRNRLTDVISEVEEFVTPTKDRALRSRQKTAAATQTQGKSFFDRRKAT